MDFIIELGVDFNLEVSEVHDPITLFWERKYSQCFSFLYETIGLDLRPKSSESLKTREQRRQFILNKIIPALAEFFPTYSQEELEKFFYSYHIQLGSFTEKVLEKWANREYNDALELLRNSVDVTTINSLLTNPQFDNEWIMYECIMPSLAAKKNLSLRQLREQYARDVLPVSRQYVEMAA